MNKYEFYSKILQEDFPVKYRQDFAEHDSEQCKKIQDLKAQLKQIESERDEAVLDVLKTAYQSGYQDGQDSPNAYSDEKIKHRIALSLLEEMMADAAMRAQGAQVGDEES